MSDTVIEVDHVWKRYRLGLLSTGTLAHDLNRWWHRVRGLSDPYAKVGEAARRQDGRATGLQDDETARQQVPSCCPAQSGPVVPSSCSPSSPAPSELSDDEMWALRDISFKVKQGDILGIIGRNGAGKSTLLKVLSRVTAPTSGEVRIKGRVASLLEIGTGFHPELTGRDNIYLNGAILGMTKGEIRNKFDEIVAFAEVEKFCDTPVKRYSSGMYVRLAFGVAAHLEPEILIVDEVLAVGDAQFQKKCLGKMGEVSREGRTVLFVSHNMQAVRQLCPRAICLDGGRKVLDAKSAEVVEAYVGADRGDTSLSEVAHSIARLPPDPVFRFREVNVEQEGRSSTTVMSGKPVRITIGYEVYQETAGLHVYFMVSEMDGSLVFESLHNGDAEGLPVVAPGGYVSRATIPADFLAAKKYALHINAAIHNLRVCVAQPLCLTLDVRAAGRVNRAYPGYVSPGKIAPLIPWHTQAIGNAKLNSI